MRQFQMGVHQPHAASSLLQSTFLVEGACGSSSWEGSSSEHWAMSPTQA